MWQRPWGYKEGIAVGAGLVATGCLLQVAIGAVNWSLLAFPANFAVLAAYVIALTAMHISRKRVYLFGWMSRHTAAVASLAWAVVMTVIMGCVRQIPSSHAPADALGFSQMVSSWPFVLVYLWLATVLGLATMRVALSRRNGKLAFLLSHLGLFVALVSATLGSADMQRLKMTAKTGEAEWRAETDDGHVKELPLAIELKDFTIDEYPPKLMLIDNGTGQALPKESPSHILLENGVKSGRLMDWRIEIVKSIPMAAMVSTADTVRYVEFQTRGAAYAVYLKAYNEKSRQKKEGWVSDGSMLFPYKALMLDSVASLVMPEREPQCFVSSVMVYTQEGEIREDTIEVNKPMDIAGWKIYQLGYDESKGRWSDVSVFELVRDPWLPAVYVGIIMMALGAVCLFLNAQKRKEAAEA